MIERIKLHNEQFVNSEKFREFETSKFPDMKTAVVSCMDTRLVTMLAAALGVKNGEVMMIKNAGGLITDPFGDSMRSLLVAIYELGVQRVMIIPHTNCGVEGMKGDHFIKTMKERGISDSSIEALRASGKDLESWLTGFDDIDKAVADSVELVKTHPLLPEGIEVEGFVIDTATGSLRQVC